MAGDETEGRDEALEDGSPRNPLVVAGVTVLIVAVATVAWWSGREDVVAVPDLVGTHVDAETLEPVKTLLQVRELAIGEVSLAECPPFGAPDAAIVSQMPAGGTEVPFGTSVDLMVCAEIAAG